MEWYSKCLAKWPARTAVITLGAMVLPLPVICSIEYNLMYVYIMLIAALSIYAAIWYHIQDKRAKAKMENLTIDEYRQMYKKYFDVVNRVDKTKFSGAEKLSDNWLKQFHKILYDAAIECRRRKFNDFDIASCLIHILVHETDNVIFAFECAKPLLTEPSIYSAYEGDGGEIKFDIEFTYSRKNIPYPDSKINSEALETIIRPLYNQQTTAGLFRLSDFLQNIYFSCT